MAKLQSPTLSLSKNTRWRPTAQTHGKLRCAHPYTEVILHPVIEACLKLIKQLKALYS